MIKEFSVDERIQGLNHVDLGYDGDFTADKIEGEGLTWKAHGEYTNGGKEREDVLCFNLREAPEDDATAGEIFTMEWDAWDL